MIQQVVQQQRPEPTQAVTRPAPVPAVEHVAQKTTAPEPQQEFTPPPVNKKSDGNDMTSLWEALLMNIKSPATKALLHLATPVKIAPDEVIITFKNDKLVSQINDTNKKQMLTDAANVMFNTDVKVIIRLPMAGDSEITASQKKNLTINLPTPPKPVQETPKVAPQKIQEPKMVENKPSSSVNNNIQPVVTEEGSDAQEKEIKRNETDQEKMILDLFDGKYIE